jgi:toxin-antitoxin system PIN domain toxin
VKLADSNVWLALTLSSHEAHAAASVWLSNQATENGVAFCRMTQISLLRLLTTAGVTNPLGNPPLTNAEAWQLYDGLQADPRIGYVDEPTDLGEHWQRCGARTSASPKLWMDAYLAAFAIAGGHQLVTFDSAFVQFDGLDLVVLSK